MARKLIIELEDKDYDEVVKLYQEFKKTTPNSNDIKLEEFVSSILKTNIEAKKKMDSMNDKFKSMMNMFDDPSTMNQMFETFFKTMQDQKNSKSSSESNKDEEKKEANQDKTKFKS